MENQHLIIRLKKTGDIVFDKEISSVTLLDDGIKVYMPDRSVALFSSRYYRINYPMIF